MINLLAVSIGGFLGAGSRYLVAEAFNSFLPNAAFPYATFTVNMLGCFLFGLAYAFLESKGLLDSSLRFFILVGFLGGLTTFSSYGFENLTLLQSQQFGLLFFNIMMQTCLGIAGLWLGIMLGYKILSYAIAL